MEHLPHTHIGMYWAPWLYHYTRKEHPTKAHPNLTTQCTCTHTHMLKHTQTHKNMLPFKQFFAAFYWQHAQWLERFIFPCVWNWAAVQADTQRKRERLGERETARGWRGYWENESSREGGKKRTNRKTRRELPRPVYNYLPPKRYD